MQAERNFLATKSKLNNLIIVNLNNESELKRIIKLLDADTNVRNTQKK